MKKETYYSVICPECGSKTVGNWKDKQIYDYGMHYWKEHCPKPIIKSEKR